MTMNSWNFERGGSPLNRRQFLLGSAAAATALRPARAQDAATRAKLDRISVMSNDFDALMPEIWDRSKPVPPKQLDIMDLPEAVADRLHLHHLEVCSINLLSMEPSYIRKFKQRLHKAKTKVVDFVLELDPPETRYRGHISICSSDPAIRAQAIEMTKKWIDIAAVLGAPSLMPNQGVHYLTDDLTPAIEGLKTVIAYAKSRNMVVILEPRGQRLEQLVQLLKGSGAYANPQTGSEAGLRLLYPMARTVQHVTLSPRFDIAHTIKIAKEVGFRGWYSIETGGPDPWASTQKAVDALVENL